MKQEKGNPEFKRWLAAYFIEMGSWKLTDKGIQKLSDPTFSMGVDHLEHAANREREEKEPYFYTDPKQSKQSAIKAAEGLIQNGRAADLFEKEYVRFHSQWKEKRVRKEVLMKFFGLFKDPREITKDDFSSNGLGGLLIVYYNNSPYRAIKELHPEINPWEMKSTPKGFFEDRENRTAAINWLLKKLDKDPREITADDFYSNGLSGLFDYYKGSPYRAIKELHPEINPWEMKITPEGFFEDRENRMAAINWLLKKLNKDPREITLVDFHSNGVGGLLDNYYNNSPYRAIKELHPEINPWEMKSTPKGFFEDRENRMAAINWLLKKLDKDPGAISRDDFYSNGLCGLFDYYKGSPYRAIKELHPEINPWEMKITPEGFFEDRENRMAAINRLLKKLNKDPREITGNDFNSNGLGALLHKYYKGSPYRAIKELHPEINPWEMKSTPKGFFEDRENRMAAINWLLKKLNKDPREITGNDFHANSLGGLLNAYYYSSPYLAIKEIHPEIRPEEMKNTPTSDDLRGEMRSAAKSIERIGRRGEERFRFKPRFKHAVF